MKENNRSTKVIVVSMLWILFLLIVGVSLWDNYKNKTSTTEVVNLDKKEEKITKEEYLKEKW